MDPRDPAFSREDLAAAFDWWHEAGVDQAFTDDVASMLAEGPAIVDASEPKTAKPPVPAPPVTPQAPEPLARFGGEEADWPAEFAGFADWWLTADGLDDGGTHPRIAPRGQKGAALLVLVPMPEAADKGQLLEGPSGGFLGAILSAMDVSADQAYFASALPRHMPHADLAALGPTGLADLTRHHIALAAPQRILAFGRDLGPLLSGVDNTPVLQTYSLAALHQRPAFRAGLWRQWLDFAGEHQA